MSGSWYRQGNFFKDEHLPGFGMPNKVVYLYLNPEMAHATIIKSISAERCFNQISIYVTPSPLYEAAIAEIYEELFFEDTIKRKGSEPEIFSMMGEGLCHPDRFVNRQAPKAFLFTTDDGIGKLFSFFIKINKKYNVEIFNQQFMQEIIKVWYSRPGNSLQHKMTKTIQNPFVNPEREESQELINLLEDTLTLTPEKLENAENMLMQGEDVNQRNCIGVNVLYFLVTRDYGHDKNGKRYNIILLGLALEYGADVFAYAGYPFHPYMPDYMYSPFELARKHHDAESFNLMMAYFERPKKSIQVTVDKTTVTSTNDQINTEIKLSIKNAEQIQHETILSELKKPASMPPEELKQNLDHLFELSYQYFRSPLGHEKSKEIFFHVAEGKNVMIECLYKMTDKQKVLKGYNIFSLETITTFANNNPATPLQGISIPLNRVSNILKTFIPVKQRPKPMASEMHHLVLHWAYSFLNKDIRHYGLTYLGFRQVFCLPQLANNLVNLYAAPINNNSFRVFHGLPIFPLLQPKHMKPLIEALVFATTDGQGKLAHKALRCFYNEVVSVAERYDPKTATPQERFFWGKILGVEEAVTHNQRTTTVLCPGGDDAFLIISKRFFDLLGIVLYNEIEKFRPHYERFLDLHGHHHSKHPLVDNTKKFIKEHSQKRPGLFNNRLALWQGVLQPSTNPKVPFGMQRSKL